MKVGFTGSRTEPTEAQLDWLASRLSALGATELHHGDCVGADAAAHTVAQVLGLRIVVHPPVNPRLRAYVEGADETRSEFPYLDRNKNIVNETAHLLALPARPEELRSGTWSTIRYARWVGRPVELELP